MKIIKNYLIISLLALVLLLAGGAGAAMPITIDYPENNSSFLHGEMIMFSGNASGGLAPYNYSWTSNLYGFIGNASTIYNSPFEGNRTHIFTFSLSPGDHTITMTVNDSSGLTNGTSINITVNPASTTNISGQSATGAMIWSASNFPAFWQENGNTSETLKVASLSGRSITGNSLWYNTTKQLIPYKVYSATGKTVERGEYCGGYYSDMGCYAKIGWFGRGYVALKGKAMKPTKLVLEQNETDSKTLLVGETWDMGDGFTLKLNSIDSVALPWQAMVTLNKSGTELGYKVAQNFTVYTYVAPSMGYESDVPMFVTYFDNISTNSIRLKYTWLVSGNLIIISAADQIGLLEVMTADDERVYLTNKDTTITLSQGSTINLADGLRFKVNNTSTLDYYPEMTLTELIPISAPGLPGGGGGGGGTLFGVGFIENMNTLVAVDPVTAEKTVVGSFPGFYGITQGVSALDATNHRYFFPMAERLFTVDTQTGAVIADPPLPFSLSSLEFDTTTNSLFGVGFIENMNTLMVINPVTAEKTVVGSFPGIGIDQGVSALDITNHRYFFPGFYGIRHLFTIDTQTGAVIADPPLPFSLASLEYDTTTNSLFGVGPIENMNTLMVVNPATAEKTVVGSFPGFYGIPQGVSALDATNHRYFFPMAERLFTVDTQTGAVIADPPLPFSLSSLEFEPPVPDTTPPAITNFTVSPSTGISSSNPATASADVADANLKGVEFLIIDSNNLVRNNQTVLGIYSNYSGISGTYTSPSWNAVSAEGTNGTVANYVTVHSVEGIAGCPECADNYVVPSLFRKNATTSEIRVGAWFNKSTLNLTRITIPEGGPEQTIENGISTIRLGRYEFANGINNPPEISVSGWKIYTLYTIGDLRNPYLVFRTVPTGNYTAHVHAEDRANNHNGRSLNITTARLGDGKIRGMKWNDANGNGIRDGESGVAGVEIWLTRMIAPGNEQIAGHISTDVNGNYSFVDLPPGFYRVEESPGARTQTFPANGRPHFINLGPGMDRKGVDFGNQPVSPGEIRGTKFNDSNSNGTRDSGEQGEQGVQICLWPSWRCDSTDTSGNYSFTVPAGTYTVYEILPSGRVATTPTWVPLTVNSGEVNTVNFGNRILVPPPSDVSIPQQYGTQNGVPTVLRPGLTSLIIRKNLTNISENVVAVNLTLRWSDGTPKRAGMTRIATTNVWEATFSPPWPSGAAQMRFEVDVAPPEPDAIQIGDIIFIDPSGQIKDVCTGAPISSANATLLVEFPPTTGNFIVSPPEKQIPPDNPLTTGTDGRYSWLTVPGSYKVKAEKTGYITAESPVVSVPPPVSGLDISLTPTGGCPVAPSGGPSGGGGTGGGGVTTSEPFENILKSERYDKDLIANVPATYTFKTPELSIYEIALTGKETENSIALRVEALKGASKLVTASPPGTIYKNVNVWAGTKRIKEALIRFKVENSWLSGNNLATSDVKMVKWDGSKWVALETAEKTKDDTFTYYDLSLKDIKK